MKKVAIVGAGLAGLTAAVDLVDGGHDVDLYEARPFMGGKVGSWEDSDGNHIEMGLHVFFYNYANLFELMKKVGALENLLPKEPRLSVSYEIKAVCNLLFKAAAVRELSSGL